MAGPLQKNLSRRVSFNEATLASSQNRHPTPPSEPEYMDTEAQPKGRPGCHSWCSSCCAWTSLILACLLLVALLLGGIYFAFFQSNLPKVRLHRLDVYKLEVANTGANTFLTSDLEVSLNVTNQNAAIELSFSQMTASLSSEGIYLGAAKLPALRQKPSTSTDIKVRTTTKKTAVEEAAAKDLESNYSKKSLVIDVVINGHIDFSMNGYKMNGFPFKVHCRSIEQSEIDNGNAPQCSLQMTPL